MCPASFLGERGGARFNFYRPLTMWTGRCSSWMRRAFSHMFRWARRKEPPVLPPRWGSRWPGPPPPAAGPPGGGRRGWLGGQGVHGDAPQAAVQQGPAHRQVVHQIPPGGVHQNGPGLYPFQKGPRSPCPGSGRSPRNGGTGHHRRRTVPPGADRSPPSSASTSGGRRWRV